MTQTAVQWLERQMKKFAVDLDLLDCVEQAKQMEKEQIVQAYSHGWHDGQDVIIDRVQHVHSGGNAAGEKLYTENYGGNQ